MAIFLRESRTRHSLLTRQKTFHQSGTQSGSNTALKSEQGPENLIANSGNLKDAEVINESDEEPEVNLHNIPQAAEEDDDGEGSTSPRRRRRGVEVQTQSEEPEDEKKLGFSTHYESFNIWGWVLCLLITRKGDKTRQDATTVPRQPLMEEFISTQAQTVLDED